MGLSFYNVVTGDHNSYFFFFGFLFDDLPGWMFQQEESDIGLTGGNNSLLTLGLGLLATALAAAYVTRLAKVRLFLISTFNITNKAITNSVPQVLLSHSSS